VVKKLVFVVVAGMALGISPAFAGAALPPLAPSHAPLRADHTAEGLSGCHLRMRKVDFNHRADTVDVRASLACDRQWERKVITFRLFWVSKKGEVPNRRQFTMDKKSVGFGPADAGRDAATVTLSCAEHADEVTRWRMRAFGLVRNGDNMPFHAKVERERLDFVC